MESVFIAAITSLSTVIVTVLTAGPALSRRARAEIREKDRKIDELESWIWDARRATRRHNAEQHPDGAGAKEHLPLPASMTERDEGK